MDPRLAHLVDSCAGSIDAFTFWLNGTLYALSIHNVLSIVQDSGAISAVPEAGAGLLGIIRYQGRPVTVFDFAARLGMRSGAEIKRELAGELTGFERQHVEWIAALENAISTGRVASVDAGPCGTEFGKWCTELTTHDESLRETLDELREVSARLAGRVGPLASASTPDPDAALEKLRTERSAQLGPLIQLFSQARQQLTELARPVILYVTANGADASFALRIDDLNHIITFSPDELTPSRGDDDLVLGYLCQEGKPDCLLINTQSFLEDRIVA